MAEVFTYPGGSRSRVNRAGENVRNGTPSPQDAEVIEAWRAAHRGVLNTFQAVLRNRTRRTDITVAQRHKRQRTIFDKLRRFPRMQLSRMDDVAGCRLIFRNIKELYGFRAQFHKARFKHKRRNDLNKYDYIKRQKTPVTAAFMTSTSTTCVLTLASRWPACVSKSSIGLWCSTLGQLL
jgi:hypothetical protein